MQRHRREFEEVRKKVLPRIKPTPEENRRIMEVVEKLMEEVKGAIREVSVPWRIRPLLVGSVAKGTHLKNPDIDIFLLFPRESGVNALHTWGIEIARKVLPEGKRLYTQHPYLRGVWMGYEVDIVPCFEISEGEDIGSMVDRTPLHTKYVSENLDEPSKDEVRLLKAFLKGIKAYGAEEAVKGFSGYLAELFIIRHGTFERALRGISRLRRGERIHLKRVEPGERRVRYTGNEPLIFVDPVDPTRNVASSISPENFKYIKKAARAYLRTPAISFFFPKRVSDVKTGKECAKRKVEEMMRKGGGVLLIDMPLPPVQPDIYVSQARRFLLKSKTIFLREGFRVKKANFYIYSPGNGGLYPPPKIKNHIPSEKEEVLFLYTFSSYSLRERKLHLGPPLNQRKRCEDFKRKWSTNENALSKVFTYNGRLAVFVKRKIRNPHQLLPDLLHMLPSHLKKSSSMRLSVSSGNNVDLEEFWEAFFLHLTAYEPWELKEDLPCDKESA